MQSRRHDAKSSECVDGSAGAERVERGQRQERMRYTGADDGAMSAQVRM